ncbi:ABC transporter permease [Photobacterium leiognathi]|uniref:Transport permease protein n=1 Tax=Photobacterium leiognathi subsp. mandapamensis TaxID=48408 RepID=A0A2T3KUL2_PHOLD|nr:ABC transporter permease [Photobacterium leiognathi]PSV10556.1 sugar ABC transporter permease [Photobacterium leiognathi subsp. mandapamensis]
MTILSNFFSVISKNNQSLILSLSKRDLQQRYQGSLLGFLWSVITPILMLGIYTFIFSVVFKAKWGVGGDKYEFAMLLFSGLIVFNLFSDIISRSSLLIVSHSNYVKKVIFPVEILPWVVTISSLVNFLISFVIWFVFYITLIGLPSIEILLIPIVIVPFCFLCAGLSYFISAIGVYLRDLNQIISLMITAIMFMTPIFYPISAIPEKYQSIMYINPLTNVIEMFRDLAIFGNDIKIYSFIIYLLSSLFVYILGYLSFKSLRKGFSDVL